LAKDVEGLLLMLRHYFDRMQLARPSCGGWRAQRQDGWWNDDVEPPTTVAIYRRWHELASGVPLLQYKVEDRGLKLPTLEKALSNSAHCDVSTRYSDFTSPLR
jgi:hypothetical protein